MNFLLNNWQNLNHSTMYGGTAFYDLWADGNDDKRAREFSSGDNCLVLSRATGGNVTISVYKFASARLATYPPSQLRKVWVLEGEFLHQEVIAKAMAIEHPQYSRFFNRLGHVNQWSVLRVA